MLKALWKMPSKFIFQKCNISTENIKNKLINDLMHQSKCNKEQIKKEPFPFQTDSINNSQSVCLTKTVQGHTLTLYSDLTMHLIDFQKLHSSKTTENNDKVKKEEIKEQYLDKNDPSVLSAILIVTKPNKKVGIVANLLIQGDSMTVEKVSVLQNPTVSHAQIKKEGILSESLYSPCQEYYQGKLKDAFKSYIRSISITDEDLSALLVHIKYCYNQKRIEWEAEIDKFIS
jgi:hypothetical protein